jgi:hypothetical protein
MASAPLTMPGINQTTELVVRDADGKAIQTFTTNEMILRQPNGSAMVYMRSGEARTLVCGSVWGPGMPVDGPTQLGGVCSFCRRPQRRLLFFRRPGQHGLCSQAAGRGCEQCGAFTCPRHRRLGEDGMWRCPDCQRREKRRALLSWLFFRIEE